MTNSAENITPQPRLPLSKCLLSISIILLMVTYGLIVRPLAFSQEAWSLEIVFLFSATLAISYLVFQGIGWQDIERAIMSRISKALPTLFILFAIGLIIASWMISGTIPMLVYYGLAWLSPEHLYITAFVVPIFFSLCTGTSWGSIATVGLVLFTSATLMGADPAITAGAIVGGAYFGDKLSPLSDTTNIAAIAVAVPLKDHIHSLLVTTLPSAFLAATGFIFLDFFTLSASHLNLQEASNLVETKHALAQLFNFHWLLLLPPLVVLIGAYKGIAALPMLIVSTATACLLALAFQGATFDNTVTTLHHGFHLDLLSANQVQASVSENISSLLNRGGLYALIGPITITLLVFVYVGALDTVNAIPTAIEGLLKRVHSKSTLVTATLFSSAITNALTSSQYANSFFTGEAFSRKYDELGLPRKVLSRSLEDTGTMIECLVPWSTTAVFIYATLGVSVFDYGPWQLLSLINILLALVFAQLGIGWFNEKTLHRKSALNE